MKQFSFYIDKIELRDLTELKVLSINNGGNPNMDEKYFEHIYFNNPSKSKSLWKVIVDSRIEGFATTNNFEICVDKKKYLCAMPQNVLTSLKLRGQGLFKKLYDCTEKDNLVNNKVDFFLTFTNALSTPIFINKFGYLRGRCPNLLLFPINLLNLFIKKNYKRIYEFDSIIFEKKYQFNNAISKSKEFYIWRYKLYDKKNLHIIATYDNEELIGYAIFIVQHKRGVNFLILSDIILYDLKKFAKVINVCKVYTSKNGFPFFIMFEMTYYQKKGLCSITLKNRFNFLVKGKTIKENDMLSNLNFNLFFGDLDII